MVTSRLMGASPAGFHYAGGLLHCEAVALSQIVASVGTPCYVYSKASIAAAVQHLATCFSALDHTICFAVKANSNLSILRLLRELGCGFDVVSGGEFYRLQRIGVPAHKILFSGVGKTRQELELALESSLSSINVESMQELDLITELAHKNAKARISLRLNPDVEVPTHPYIATGLRQHKFGIDPSALDQIISRLRKARYLELVGVACHIGSQILDIQPFLSAFVRLHELGQLLRAEGFSIAHLDLGGGFGIPHRGETGPDLALYATFISERVGDYSVYFEPGRAIVGPAGALVCKVLYTKANQGRRFVIVDGAMNDFLRPTLYQAYHEILTLREAKPRQKVDVVGPVCESSDFFARDREMGPVEQGDHLAVMNAGAYGFVLSSNYNSRIRAVEVLVDGTDFRIIRSRETWEDLVRSELDWLG